ncbi:LysR family transcriptional regulator [Sphingobium sufflavum]|uniref:LysR family transcriptional regulator n=1 Tax=Sphingobium sufflavum TaxID=1129547 RepID=UPI001F1FE896|nr:LysR family transcriptional regulator [Sphingobium sufflavum]MCE7796201.1 LysR family transcriptional regulator [Sphingobium sufflavum]
MDLRPLRHFIAVADTLHFGRAAERLGMTQPPLSQSILALERAVGAPLFVRSKRSVALTPFGRQWLAHVRPAVEGIDALPTLAQRLQTGLLGRLSLAFVSTADYSLLPRLVQHYSAAFPDVELELVEATSDIQVAALVAGEIDAGIVISARATLPSALDYRPLLREPLVAAVPESWIADGLLDVAGAGGGTSAKDKDGSGADDRAARVIAPGGGGGGGDGGGEALLLHGDGWMTRPLIIFPARVSPDFHELVLGYYRSRGHEPVIRQEAIQMQTIISLVSAGLGMALVPASLRHLARTGVRYIAFAEGAPELETGLAWRREDDAPTVAALVAIAMGLEG